ncbi:hypothetical protein D1007_37460 [Hordeum vulgare]|nr:hypothetical protein D1007_37460 [Hordeum vulgare]
MSTREDQIVALATGDEDKLWWLREISIWFSHKERLNDAVLVIKDKLRDDKLLRCFPRSQPQPAMGLILWAMMETDSPDPMKRNKWKLFKLLRYRVDLLRHASPPEVEVSMGLPIPGSRVYLSRS